MILFGELYYRAKGEDTNFDPEFTKSSFAADMRIHAKNATQVLAYVSADLIVSPTHWQASTFPRMLREHIQVLHEGVDLTRAARRVGGRVRLADGRTLDGSRPVVTFVNRTLEPLRGFHIFMRALPEFLDGAPDAEVLLIGQEAQSGYGGSAPNDGTWKALLLAELGDRIDLSRVHFMGTVPHAELIDVFSISWAHVYHTYPFVLSWSLIEAMACECLVIASDTPPVLDAITDGKDGILVPFFDIAALSQTLLRAVREPARFSDVRAAARERALSFDRDAGVRGWLDLIDRNARKVRRFGQCKRKGTRIASTIGPSR
jgi:glycosyltransferase involved in cell wall biosynthesis